MLQCVLRRSEAHVCVTTSVGTAQKIEQIEHDYTQGVEYNECHECLRVHC
jgi:hypothetical protein